MEQVLEIMEEINNQQGKGLALGSLGNGYKGLGENELALDYYIRALQIAREIGDRKATATELYNMGSLLNKLKRYAEAIPLLEEALELVKVMGLMHRISDAERTLAKARVGLASSDNKGAVE